MLRYLSLFSGIGAFEKALTNLGVKYEIVNYCEIDKYASKSYSAIHNVPESKNLWDVTKINVFNLPKDIDIISHGSPCQDFSIAGSQAGGDKGSGTRSSLMWNTVDIVEYCKPKIVMWENVKNLVSKAHKHNFDDYIKTMDNLGYNSYWKVLNSKDYGIPQNRQRVYTISIRKDIDHKLFEFPKPYSLEKKLKDLLEPSVDEKYYLSDAMIKYISATGTTNYISKDLPDNCDLMEVFDYRYDEGIRPRKDGICPTLPSSHLGTSSLSGQPLLLIREATKKGYAIAEEGDSVNLAYPNSDTRRGRVGKQVSQTLTCNDNIGVVVKDE